MTQRREVTILFADAVDSTRLFEQRGDTAARQLLAQLLRTLDGVARAHGGRTVKTVGDQIMCTFPEALAGVLAAVDMQARLHDERGRYEDTLAIRIGLHHGEVLCEQDDFFGDAVNIAARMADSSIAQPGQIITTATTVARITVSRSLTIRPLGEIEVQGKQQPIATVEVRWQRGRWGTTTALQALPPKPVPVALTLRHRARALVCDAGTQTLSLGRDPRCHVVTDHAWVSRQHAAVEYRRGHLLLIDRSTNGTWVCMDDQPEVRLHRDELRLVRCGTLSLGRPHVGSDADLVYFAREH